MGNIGAILTQLVAILTGGLTSFGQGIGQALSTIVSSMFIDSTGDTWTLSVFGGIIAVFGGISLAIGLTRKVFGLLTSFGARK